MRARVLTLAVTAALAFAAPPPASTASKRLPAQLGFIVFCKTSMTDVTAQLGPGRRFHDGVFAWRGWYDPTSRVYLLVASGLSDSPHVFRAILADEKSKDRNLDDIALKAADLGRPRFSLTSLRGPKGIRLRDSRDRVFQLLGEGALVGRRGSVEGYDFGPLRPAVRSGDCGEAGFNFVISFTEGKLTRIWIIQAS